MSKKSIKKQLAAGIFLLKSGEVWIRATKWGVPGKREDTLPAGTPLTRASGRRDELLEELESLKRSAIDAAREQNPCSLTYDTLKDLIELHRRDLGCYRFDRTFADIEKRYGPTANDLDALKAAYQENERWMETYISKLTKKELSPCTKNHYRRIFKMIFRHAHDEGKLLDKGSPAARVPLKIKVASAKKLARKRILSESEQAKLLKKMGDPAIPISIDDFIYHNGMLWPSEKRSTLRWVIGFALVNPIRPGDLRAMRKSSYCPIRKEVKFFASKTAERTCSYTYLRNIPEWFSAYVASIPSDCPWLFPILSVDTKGVVKWQKRGSFKTAWVNFMGRVGLDDFHFHDLKRCATTYMRRVQGYTPDEFKALGLYFSDIIDVYTDFKADAVPRREMVDKAKLVEFSQTA